MKKLRIKKLDMMDPKARARYEKIRKQLDKKYAPIVKAIRDSQRITAEDLATRINV